MVRLSLKLFNITPDQLPASLLRAVENLLTSDPVGAGARVWLPQTSPALPPFSGGRGGGVESCYPGALLAAPRAFSF